MCVALGSNSGRFGVFWMGCSSSLVSTVSVVVTDIADVVFTFL